MNCILYAEGSTFTSYSKGSETYTLVRESGIYYGTRTEMRAGQPYLIHLEASEAERGYHLLAKSYSQSHAGRLGSPLLKARSALPV